MKSSIYKSYDKLPLLLHSDIVSKALGFAPSSDYELMHEKKIPHTAGANEASIRRAFDANNICVRSCSEAIFL